MRALYIVHEFETDTLFENQDFFETKIALEFGGEKVYKVQLDELIILDKDVVVVTFDVDKIFNYRNDIREFYDKYHKGDM